MTPDTVLAFIFGEQSMAAVITSIGAIIAALIVAFGTVFVVIAERGRRNSAAALHELKPNSGNSAFDKLTERLDSIDGKLDADNDRLGHLEHRLGEHIAQSELIVRSLKKGTP